ncbi:hypothetical protein [Rhodovulum adriaticum]|uniref:PH (Pleckstrin Homology) domain-containing protein n=1 Tax=Rhodovulum adriaticum TaxID=35804 RepID=A0A4R2NK17_RHOAD|nr:hypothetical protein [Rhodovulum adriaticum]MBK1635575.1 hypothetical protein [Rhodovulum adriaticum]TCP21791.1 hypothetical protein EV656_10943 [Rhodovulum adriaticum]
MFDPKLQTPLDDGETALARFQPDRGTYIKAHVMLAVLGGLAATLGLALIGNPYPWAGIVAGVLGVGTRGAYLMKEELAMQWTLTDRALLGPGGRRILLGNIRTARKLGSAVQVVTISGDKHLVKFLSDPDAVRARIDSARGTAQ